MRRFTLLSLLVYMNSVIVVERLSTPSIFLSMVLYEPIVCCDKSPVPEDVFRHHDDGVFHIHNLRQTLTEMIIEVSSICRSVKGTINNLHHS